MCYLKCEMTIAADHHVGVGDVGIGMQSCSHAGWREEQKKNQTKFMCGSHVAPSPAPVMQ